MNRTETVRTIEDVQRSLQSFGVVDYVVFILMLVGCSFIGLYYALRSKKSSGNVEDEYLMGGRNMAVFPISMSLVASYISGITLLGNPTELYVYGTQYLFVTLGIFLCALAASYVYIPVFHDLKLSSTYEYLEKRFDKKVRLLGFVQFAIGMTVWLPIVIYIPALAFNQVTGIDVHIITPCVCVVCIFYTCVGGLKAVVWTDVVQTVIMYAAIMFIVIKGTMAVGGFGTVWDKSLESGRIELPSHELDFTLRHSLWSVTIGAACFYLQSGVTNQNMIQRYMSLPTLSDAKKALCIYVIGQLLFIWTCCYAGLVVYAMYYDCDPITTRLAKAKDQLFPLLVMEVVGDYSGLPGLFVAGIFSASLSSLSTGLNAMSAVVLQDLVKPLVKGNISERTTNVIMKGTVVIFGTFCVAMVYVVEKLGTVLQLAMSLGSIASGPTLGMFTCGMLLPWVNAKGMFYGSLLSLLANAFVILGAQNALSSGSLKFPTKPVSVEGCDYLFNTTRPFLNNTINAVEEDIFPYFKMSYLWYVPHGMLVNVVCSLIVSFIVGSTDISKVDLRYLSPVIRRFMPSSKRETGTMEEGVKMLKNGFKN